MMGLHWSEIVMIGAGLLALTEVGLIIRDNLRNHNRT
jgi:hypothetical protein